MKKFIFWFLPLVFVLVSCSQDEIATDDVADDNIYVRVENAMTDRLDSVWTGYNGFYGSIMPGMITEYKLLTPPVYFAGCGFKINAQRFTAGDIICPTPPPPQFKGGYYTFKVLPVPVGQNRFRLEVSKQ